MKAVLVVRHRCGAVDEVPIQGSPEAINQLVLNGWELYLPWSLLDYVVLAVWCLIGLVMGAAAFAWTLPAW